MGPKIIKNNLQDFHLIHLMKNSIFSLKNALFQSEY